MTGNDLVDNAHCAFGNSKDHRMSALVIQNRFLEFAGNGECGLGAVTEKRVFLWTDELFKVVEYGLIDRVRGGYPQRHVLLDTSLPNPYQNLFPYRLVQDDDAPALKRVAKRSLAAQDAVFARDEDMVGFSDGSVYAIVAIAKTGWQVGSWSRRGRKKNRLVGVRNWRDRKCVNREGEGGYKQAGSHIVRD
jgi:hypothetical protein